MIKSHPEVRFWAYTRVATAALFLQAQKLDNITPAGSSFFAMF